MSEMMEFDPSKLTGEQALELHLKAERYKAEVKEQARRDAENEMYRQQQAEADQLAAAETEKQRQEQHIQDMAALPRVETLSGYLSLSASSKASYCEVYGSNFPAELKAKEASGLDWQAYDKVSSEAKRRADVRAGRITEAQSQGESYARLREAAEHIQYLKFRSRAEEFSDEELAQAREHVEKGWKSK